MNSDYIQLQEQEVDFDELIQSAIEFEETAQTQIQALNIYESNEEFLIHYGVGHEDNPPGPGSGRFPYGSGEHPGQHQAYTLAKQVKELRDQGLTPSEIAKGLGYKSTTQLRAYISMEKDRAKVYYKTEVPRLFNSGMSRKEIGDRLGISYTSVRNYLDEDRKLQIGKTQTVVNTLKDELAKKRYLDVGAGVELELENGISKERLKTALEMLEAEGYKIHNISVQQLGNPGKYTNMRILGTPDTEWVEVQKDPSLVQTVTSYITDNGQTSLGLLPVRSIDSDRVHIRYADEVGPDGVKGIERDGIIQLRRGVDEISLGKSNYAQVRIGVDDKYYMKGMAVYGDDSLFPDGCDIIYNSNKKLGTPPEDVFKKMKMIKDADGNEIGVNWENPFGASVMQNHFDDNGKLTAGGQSSFIDKNGEEKLRVINKVNERGGWREWTLTASPQFLSKQRPEMIEKQLRLTIEDKQAEYEDIMTVTNETVRRKLLEDFRDDLYASANHLKAKSFPEQTSNVLISIPSLGENECYAPNYSHGEWLANIRFPHAGPQEIVVVRNNLFNKEAIDTIGPSAPDAIGLHPSQYPKLSGADSDGDTVITIPMSKTKVLSKPIFEGLQDFDTKEYKFKDPNAVGITSQNKQTEMGKATNLIADMGILNASEAELERAIKYSMVVIDSEKHHLDYKKAFDDLDIRSLKKKYQGSANGGASTLITRAGSEAHIPERRYLGIDPVTGKDRYEETGKTIKKRVDTKTKGTYYKDEEKTEKVTKMDVARTTGGNAMDLLSSKTNPHPVEVLYGNYANELIRMGDEIGKQIVRAPKLKYDPQAAREYAAQVESLDDKIIRALKNAPRERAAQRIGYTAYKAQLDANPSLVDDKPEKKKVKGQALAQARDLVGAKKPLIVPTPKEIEAINKGAISDSKLMTLLNNADMDVIRKVFQPQTTRGLSASMESLARSMAANGYSNADIAARLGVSASTISKVVNA